MRSTTQKTQLGQMLVWTVVLLLCAIGIIYYAIDNGML